MIDRDKGVTISSFCLPLAEQWHVQTDIQLSFCYGVNDIGSRFR